MPAHDLFDLGRAQPSYFPDLHILTEQRVNDLASVNLPFSRQLFHEIGYLRVELNREIEFAVRIGEFTSNTF